MRFEPIDRSNSFEEKECFIAFFDILGTKAHEDSSLIAQTINEINEALNFFIELHGWLSGDIDIKKKVFSDNFCLFTKENYDVLLRLIGSIQVEIMQMGTFIRGAVCHGSLAFNEEFLYGKGLIDAYEIESKISIFPRIVIDNSFFEGAAKIATYKNQKPVSPEEICNKLESSMDCLTDSDCLKFVNYLQALKGNKEKAGGPDGLLMKALGAHAKHIIDNINNAKDKKIEKKYQWCKNYHNMFCRHYQYQDLIIK